MTKVKKIWDELTNDKSLSKGLLFRRYSVDVLPDVFVALQNPEQFHCIFFAINEKIVVNTSGFSNLQDIQVDLYVSPYEKGKNILIFKLLDLDHIDIFSVLCEDLIKTISREHNEEILIREVLNRFEKWKSLFNKISLQGLTSEEQRGLYGELYFLRKYLSTYNNHIFIINTWIGTEKQVRDFQSGSWAVEVKTTHGNNHQKVQISSERQLDNSKLDYLFLYHISLEKLQNTGETLNDIVDSIAEILKYDIIVLNRYKCKLYEVGFFDFNRFLYQSIGYRIRQDTFYKVENDFPRIEENDVRRGVGDVKYSIILSQCTSFTYNESNLFHILTS